MHVSVLIATYNRPEALGRAVRSVYNQTYKDWDLTIINDCPDYPITAEHERTKVINNRVNKGQEHGDLEHIRRFLKHHCEGDAWVYLCDDDRWIPDTLLAEQVSLMAPDVSFVLGGMAQNFPNAIHPSFMPKVFPARMTGLEYLDLLAEDPANRNIVSGACLFRNRGAEHLERARGVRWQAGYLLTIDPALAGDVVYLDKPCVLAQVDAKSASYSGTQMTHLNDGLNSIAAGFNKREPELCNKMMQSFLMIYVNNKLGHKLGYGFATDVDHQFIEYITADAFFEVARQHRISLLPKVAFLIRCSDDDSTKPDWPWLMAMCK